MHWLVCSTWGPRVVAEVKMVGEDERGFVREAERFDRDAVLVEHDGVSLELVEAVESLP